MFTRNITRVLAMLGTVTALAVMTALPAFAANDASIDKAVHDALGRFNESVTVQVHDGHVDLSGQVGTYDEEMYIVNQVHQINGVTVVNDNMEAISGNEGE
ncbi:MAG: hypothetical protein DELT_00035 [Desulfovibrio sp.]